MKEIILEAKRKVEAENAEFGYQAGPLEIAANIWHSHLDSTQRFGISQNEGDFNKKDISVMYRAVERFFDA